MSGRPVVIQVLDNRVVRQGFVVEGRLGQRGELALAVVDVQEVRLDRVFLLQQLLFGVVGPGQPGVGRHVQVEPTAVEDVGKDTADRRRFAVQARLGGDVAGTCRCPGS